MSAFAVIYERSNNALMDASIFNKVMERLSHRGPDGKDIVTTGNVTMGHWHFWTTPEEVGERQPLELNNLPFKIVLDGRIDNRTEIILQLDLDLAEATALSDAALILIAYQRWNRNCFKYFVGDFALVILDEQKNELVCARDHIGNRTLFYEVNLSRFVIASEPWAVLGAKNSEPELNESVASYYFALRVPEDGQTFFKGVHELLPAHIISVDSSGHTVWCYWQPDPHKKIRYKTDKEYVQHFLALLEESIHCRMRSNTPVGVLMSGGLDSTTIACLSARKLFPESLTTISNIYDELTECDESEYINAVKMQYGLDSIQIPCDDAWPYKNWQYWNVNPNEPEKNIYQIGKERDYKQAQKKGLRILLTGGAGDHLYAASQEWMADLIMEGRFSDALKGFGNQIQKLGLMKALTTGSLRSVIRVLLKRFMPFLIKLHRLKVTHPVWLQPAITSFLKKNESIHPELERHDPLLGPMVTHAYSSWEPFFASRYNIELRFPYRDRRLVEFFIGIPAYMLYSKGQHKHILRVAMQGVLPEVVRLRTRQTPLKELFLRGLEREKNALEQNLYGKNHAWQEFVTPEWLPRDLSTFVESVENDHLRAFLSWICISYEVWHKSLFQ